MDSSSQTQNVFVGWDEVYEDAVDYLGDDLEDEEGDGVFEDALERYQVEVVDSDDIVAELRYDAEGGLECRFEGKVYWHPACHHVEIRERLYRDAAELGQYDFGREVGVDAWDNISFLASQKMWGLDRAHRPQELFLYEQPPHRRSQVLGSVQPMYRYGRLVLDLHDHLIKDYQHIPDTLSSEFEGAYMEAITRMDKRINTDDFRARMPPRITSQGVQRDLYVSNIFSSRMRRFREATFNLVWTVRRSGSDIIKGFIDSFLPLECKTNNSTRNFRDMYKHESVMKEMLTFGQFSFRAGNNGRAVSNTRREASYKKLVAKYDKLYAAFVKDQQILASSSLPYSTTPIETPAYYQLLSNWRAIIARQHGEVAANQGEDTTTPPDEGKGRSTITLASGEEEGNAATDLGGSSSRKRSIADIEEVDVYEGGTRTNKRPRLSSADLLAKNAEFDDISHSYHMAGGAVPQTAFRTEIAPSADLRSREQDSKGQKRGFDSIHCDALDGGGVSPLLHPEASRLAKRQRRTEDGPSLLTRNISHGTEFRSPLSPASRARLREPRPTPRENLGRGNTKTHVGGHRSNNGLGHTTQRTSPESHRSRPGTTHNLQTHTNLSTISSAMGNTNNSQPATVVNRPQYGGLYQQFDNKPPPPYFARDPCSELLPYPEQPRLGGRQPLRRRPPPTVYPPLQCELMQEHVTRTAPMSDIGNSPTVDGGLSASDQRSFGTIAPLEEYEPRGGAHMCRKDQGVSNMERVGHESALEQDNPIVTGDPGSPVISPLPATVNCTVGNRVNQQPHDSFGLDGEDPFWQGLDQTFAAETSDPSHQQYSAKGNVVEERGTHENSKQLPDCCDFGDESFWQEWDRTFPNSTSDPFAQQQPTGPEGHEEISPSTGVGVPSNFVNSYAEAPQIPALEIPNFINDMDEAGFRAVCDVMTDEELAVCGFMRPVSKGH